MAEELMARIKQLEYERWLLDVGADSRDTFSYDWIFDQGCKYHAWREGGVVWILSLWIDGVQQWTRQCETIEDAMKFANDDREKWRKEQNSCRKN